MLVSDHREDGAEPDGNVRAADESAGYRTAVQPRVLVVEDDDTVADVLREVLLDQPYQCVFAASAEEALGLAKKAGRRRTAQHDAGHTH